MTNVRKIRKKAFFDCIKTEFAPKLREMGFRGSGQNFRRIQEDLIHAINIQINKYGGSCCVNLGIHPTFLPLKGSGDQLPDPKKIPAWRCIMNWRLAPSGNTSFWWDYGIGGLQLQGKWIRSGMETVEVAQHLIQTYEAHGETRFQKVMTIEMLTDVFSSETIGSDEVLPLWNLTTAGRALLMIRIHTHFGNQELVRRYTELGLKQSNETWFKAALEELLSKPTK